MHTSGVNFFIFSIINNENIKYKIPFSKKMRKSEKQNMIAKKSWKIIIISKKTNKEEKIQHKALLFLLVNWANKRWRSRWWLPDTPLFVSSATLTVHWWSIQRSGLSDRIGTSFFFFLLCFQALGLSLFNYCLIMISCIIKVWLWLVAISKKSIMWIHSGDSFSK